MTVRVGMLKSGMTAEDHRLAVGVFAAPQGSVFQTRSGLVDGTTVTLTKVSGMTARVSPFQAWIDGTSSALQGGYPFTNDANHAVTFADGDATRDRIDLVVARVYDNTYDGSGFTEGRVEVVQGAYPVSGQPVPPAAPPSSLVLFEQRINAGTSSGTGGYDPGLTTLKATPLHLGPVPVSSAAERDALPRFTNLRVQRLDSPGIEQVWTGSRWVSTGPSVRYGPDAGFPAGVTATSAEVVHNRCTVPSAPFDRVLTISAGAWTTYSQDNEYEVLLYGGATLLERSRKKGIDGRTHKLGRSVLLTAGAPYVIEVRIVRVAGTGQVAASGGTFGTLDVAASPA